NHLAVTVGSAGAVTYNATGASAGHSFSDLVTAAAGLTVTSGQTLTVTGATITGLTAASVAPGTFPVGTFTFQEVQASGSIVAGGGLLVAGDPGIGTISAITFTDVSNTAGNSSGVGQILLKGTTSRDSTGFIKIWVGTTAYYVPFFATITG
ncbi:MAG TPA: hypothetical protein VMY42_22535, partial [Thermoguttaceae bacterium]|nr:hypothetical protein [Thermoguttaceae bacterium]